MKKNEFSTKKGLKHKKTGISSHVNNPMITPLVKAFTDAGREKAPFELFVELAPGVPSWLPNNLRKWTYRSDKYCQGNVNLQLLKLVKLARRRFTTCRVITIYDNRIPATEEQHMLLHVVAGQVEIHNLPAWIKTKPV